MGIREDYAPFIDSQGYVSDYPGPTLYSSGNLLRYTSEYYIALHQSGEITPADVAKFISLVEACWGSEPGLLRRYPGYKDQESPDDYYLIVAAAKIIGATEIAKKILDYGKRHHWNYNNYPERVPTWRNTSAWFWRMPWLIAHFHFCADETPACFLNYFWKKYVEHQSGPDKDPWALSYSLVLTAPESDDRKASKKQWLDSLHKSYPGGIPQVMAGAFIKGPHPSRLWYGLETASK